MGAFLAPSASPRVNRTWMTKYPEGNEGAFQLPLCRQYSLNVSPRTGFPRAAFIKGRFMGLGLSTVQYCPYRPLTEFNNFCES